MRRLWVYAIAAALAALTVLTAGSAIAGGKHDRGGGSFSARLNGYNEVTGPPNGGSISTVGRGRFQAKIDKSAKTIKYRLTYVLENSALFSHIHFAQRHVNGGIAAFLCGGGSKPPCPAGVGAPVTVTGTITPADVIGPAPQGIEAGSFDELVRAMKAGATYVNVHSSRWPAGEIRGQIGHKDEDEGDRHR
jgi:CHRD domain